MTYAYIAVIALSDDSASSVDNRFSVLIKIWTGYGAATSYGNLVVAVLAAAAEVQ